MLSFKTTKDNSSRYLSSVNSQTRMGTSLQIEAIDIFPIKSSVFHLSSSESIPSPHNIRRPNGVVQNELTKLEKPRANHVQTSLPVQEPVYW